MKTYEDVIEQLGGYDKAKEVYDKYYGCTLSLYSNTIGGILVQELKQYLLEYRRENKFFEEGDFVTYIWLDNKVDKYNPECIIKSPWRHSTDEEIEAYKHLN